MIEKESILHMSLFPLFMTHIDGVIMSPVVNHHCLINTRASEIIDREEHVCSDSDDEHNLGESIQIDGKYCVWFYILENIQDGEDNETTRGTGLTSVNFISKDKNTFPALCHSDTSRANEVTLEISSDCFNGLHDDARKRVEDRRKDEDRVEEEVSNNIQDFLNGLSGLKIVDRDSATSFSQVCKLDDVDITDDIHATYNSIFKEFQQKFKIRMAFVEGMHRSYSIFMACFNIEQDATKNMY